VPAVYGRGFAADRFCAIELIMTLKSLPSLPGFIYVRARFNNQLAERRLDCRRRGTVAVEGVPIYCALPHCIASPLYESLARPTPR